MKRVLITIAFQQQPSSSYPLRSGTLIFGFCHEFEIESTWRNLADTGKMTLPKNVYVLDQNNKPVPLSGSNVNIGGFSTNAPLFMRGDKVAIQWGYALNSIPPMTDVFSGYITRVNSKKPIELELMDSMYLLQQCQAPVKEWTGTVENMLKSIISAANIPLTVNTGTQTSIGNFRTGNETIAQVLGRLRKEYNFDAYFRGSELRCGSTIYVTADANPVVTIFKFQQDIIKDELKYNRTDDLILSAVCHNTVETNEDKNGNVYGTTKDGQPKTRKIKLEVLISIAGNGTVTYFSKQEGQPLPENIGGERREFFIPQATTLLYLEEQGLKQLKKYFYTGFTGKFTAFGLPFVKHGDDLILVDPVLPERNGRYKVRGVKYSGGVKGLRQEITLDYLVYRTDANGNQILE